MSTLTGASKAWNSFNPRRQWIAVAIPVLVIAPALCVTAAAPGKIFGDPSEYQFIGRG
jgi:hypothetical protein